MTLQEQFDTRGPWISKFQIDGADSGGWFDVLHDDRAIRWLATIPGGVRTILECGTLEGGHTALLAMSPGVTRVVGLEAREANIKKARFIHDLLGIQNSTFIQADLEQGVLNQFGDFDATWCSGLLYHLPHPVAFLKQLTTRYVFLGTHFSHARTVSHEGMRGRWYTEPGGLANVLGGMSPKSFWLTLDSLREVITECGYSIRAERVTTAPNGEWVDLYLEKP